MVNETAQSVMSDIVVRWGLKYVSGLLLQSSISTRIGYPRNRMSGILQVRICGEAGG